MRSILGPVPVPLFAVVAVFAAFPPVAPAAAKMTLSQCIAKEQQCKTGCIDVDAPVVDPKWTFCFNRCEANHAACVDLAMDLSADGGDGPSVKPPKANVGAAAPKAGLLDAQPGFSPQGPAPTGAPLGAAAAPQLR